MIKIKKLKWDSIIINEKVITNFKFIMNLCLKNNWEFIKYHEKTYTLNLKRDKIKMNVYLSTLTIQTAMNHPKSGKTQLNRKGLNKKQITRLFENPRIHTNKGYYIKNK